MIINFEEIQKIVEGCYRVARDADLPLTLPLIERLDDGRHQLDNMRLEVFRSLVQKLVPSYQIVDSKCEADMKMTDRKEPWQD